MTLLEAWVISRALGDGWTIYSRPDRTFAVGRAPRCNYGI
jgi:hypothetical protein